LDDDPVIAGENTSDLALVPLGQQLYAHSGIIQLGAEVRVVRRGLQGLAPAGEVRGSASCARSALLFGRSVGVRCVAGEGKGFQRERNRRFRSLWDTGRACETHTDPSTPAVWLSPDLFYPCLVPATPGRVIAVRRPRQ
jgi:hypothetical protein